MLPNAYFFAKFRFDTAENEPAKNLQNLLFFPILLTLTSSSRRTVLQVRETRTVISRCTGSSHPAADPWPRRRPYPLSVLHPRPSFRSQHRRPVHAAKFGLSELEQIFV